MPFFFRSFQDIVKTSIATVEPNCERTSLVAVEPPICDSLLVGGLRRQLDAESVECFGRHGSGYLETMAALEKLQCHTGLRS